MKTSNSTFRAFILTLATIGFIGSIGPAAAVTTTPCPAGQHLVVISETYYYCEADPVKKK
jgi:hypothetical protein